jgi:transposase
MIAHEHTKLHVWIPPTPEQREMDRLLKRRAKLSSLRQALAMSLSRLDGFGAGLKALRARFDLVIARIDQRVKTLIEASPDRKEHVTHLRMIYGVGPVVSAGLVNIPRRRGLVRLAAYAAFVAATLAF